MQPSGDLLSQNPFADLDIPPELEESITRHRVHLAQLVQSMKIAGVSETQIEESVSVLIASYKEELMRAIKSMVR